MTERLVVIGGDAAGMTAASQAKRARGEDIEVVALERGHHASYSACGIPYWVAGDVESDERLVARTPEEHRRRGIDLRMRHEAEGIDLDRRELSVRDLVAGTAYTLGFDQLVVATGAVPVRPDVPGVDADGVYGVQTLDDGQAVIEVLTRERPGTAVVVGCGYIGVEMAEALVRHGVEVTLGDQALEPMTALDPDMGRLVRDAVEGMGMRVRLGRGVERFDVDASGHVRGVVAGGETFPADLVVLGIGVRPDTRLAAQVGLPIGASGGLRVDLRMAVPGFDGVWAGGDCVETFNLVSQTWGHVPLGTHANKHGRVIGANVAGGYATFPGVVGTAMTKVCELEIARTGLQESEATAAGFRYEAVRVEATTRAGYFPGARPMTVKMLAERTTGRLLGAQIVGREGSAKRIDVCAVALWNRMTVEEMTGLDLGYAPPFSPVWDPVLVAARKAASAVARP
ncbi:MAG TPA: FAD-dependent oxidoreductase [Candidatus Eisenbacteria bacterium]|nr:FAD-dependent oxidoreductase [Candidatus Eisenbacteria bacterium]